MQLLRPITTRAGSAMNQSQFLAIICNSLQAREKSRVHGAIGFGFASHWLKNWRESFKPITKRSNRDHVIPFDSHLKTALTLTTCYINWQPKKLFIYFLPDPIFPIRILQKRKKKGQKRKKKGRKSKNDIAVISFFEEHSMRCTVFH